MASYTKHDLEFILKQIKIAEADVAGGAAINVRDLVAVPELPFGLRTVNGTQNNLLLPAQSAFGSADRIFERLLQPEFNNAEGATMDPDGPGPLGVGAPTSYLQTSGLVFDSQPRTISNLIVDQTSRNPAATAAAAERADLGGGVLETLPNGASHYFIPNKATDEGLSAQYNSWFTLFGQFFDHGLDLAAKGQNGTVFIPLKPDDPLYNPAPGAANFMVLSRTNQVAGPGADGILVDNPNTAVNEAADNTAHEALNTTSPFVDQNQTYGSHPSKQVFLRAYELVGGQPVDTGKLIEHATGGMATWADVKAQARDILGINLTDADVNNLPLLATDDYGNFIRGSAGFPQVVFAGNVLQQGNIGAPVDASGAVRTGHAFLDDIAHTAAPRNSNGSMKTADGNDVVGGAGAGEYDNELLNAHYIAGDGRVNENIGLTAVHAIFHSEHNRLVEHTKEVVLASGDLAFLNEWLRVDVGAIPASVAGLSWDGERLFQAAKFGTEMQYQHLVFEEFARKIQPQVDVFAGFDSTINPAIVAEFAHVVYRFGHSMLTETVDRFNPNFGLVNGTEQIGLIEAFLNPLEFAASGPSSAEATGAIVRGMTRQVGNEIDEFVTEALRNNLVGLPLDLAALNLARGRETGVPTLNEARRDFFAGTSDAQLKPYVSWVDFANNSKHAESVINFIAAYGTHTALKAADVDTLAEKRAVAFALVNGGNATINDGTAVRTFTADNTDRLAFLNSTGSYANLTGGVTTTGVDAIDFWIGGLAERQMPFGGLLGSTFNFVFETQMEKLQDGDRLYYLARTAGLNFLTELEANSFASLIMANTDAKHLPGDVFSVPNFILEVDRTKQFNEGLGSADPTGGTIFSALVVRDNPNSLKFTGGEHVVLGGTSGNDTLTASIGDDTIWGDGGNDRIEGGAGNDILNGGAGDDIMTDSGGDDNFKGNEGNDVINGGNGFDLIIAGGGSDFVVAGEDPKEVFGNQGNDFILGSSTFDTIFGNQGDDWIDGGGQADLLQGDMGDPFQESTVFGNDVIIGGGGNDDYDSESGDDIMVMGAGTQRAEGMLGFDWVTHKNQAVGAAADLNFTGLLPATIDNLKDRFDNVEGVSGWKNDDVLRGDSFGSVALLAPVVAGDLRTNHALNSAAQIATIDGLQAFLDGMLGAGQTGFSGGNILMGGEGSDTLEGRGGNDLIDGDAWLNVRIKVTGHPTITSAESMAEIAPRLFSREINPSQLSIVREILQTPPSLTDLDTAVFTGNFSEYTFTNNNGLRTVSHNDTTALGDGVDTLRNVERLQFADQTVVIAGTNAVGTGTVTISDTTPTEDSPLSVTGLFTDADGVNLATVIYRWESLVLADPDTWIEVARGTSFTPGDSEAGRPLRVRATFDDQKGVTETVVSAATAPVQNVNDAPVGTATAVLTDGSEDVPYLVSVADLLAGFTDVDVGDVLNVANLSSANGTFAPGPAGSFTFTPASNFNGPVTVTYNVVDGNGGTRAATQTFTLAPVNDAPTGTATGVITGSVVNNAFTVRPADLLLGFRDVDGDILSVTELRPSVGVLTTGADGNFIITQAAGFSGPVTLSYRVVDGPGASVAGTQTYTHGSTAVNSPATGTLRIASYVATDASASLTAVSTIADANLPALVPTYQWQKFDTVAGVYVNIAGPAGTAATLANQINGTYRVTTSYTDAFGTNTFISAERAILGSVNVNNLTGTGGADFVLGLGGSDTSLVGGAGNDTVDGGGGDDILRAGLNDGNDVYLGGTGIDAYDLSLTAAAATVNLSLGTSSSSATGTDTLTAIENVRGSSGADRITNGAGSNDLAGNGGNDTFVMTVDGFRDILNGGAGGVDTADYSAYLVALNVTLGTAAVVNGSGSTAAASDLVTDIENFVGGSQNDVITGSAGANQLTGGIGNDTLAGAAGRDILVGGAGADVFDYNATSDSPVGTATRDQISDFLRGSDKLDFSTIDANTGVLNNQAFTLNTTAGAAITGAGQLVYRLEGTAGTTSALTVVQGNVDGVVGADFEVALIGHHRLVAADIIL